MSMAPPLQTGLSSPSNPPFAGRERVVRDLVAGVLADPPASFSLVGSKFVGKSRLLNFLASEEGPLLSDAYAPLRPPAWQDGLRILPVRLDCSVPAASENFMGFLAQQAMAALRREGGLGLRLESLERQPPAHQLLGMARQLAEDDYRLVFLLDHFDRVFGNLPLDTLNEMRPLTYHAAFVVASEQPLHDLDRSLAASPLFNVMTQVFLGLVEPEVARQWLLAYADEYPGLRPLVNDLPEMTATHPYLLRRLGDILDEVAQMIPAGVEMGPEHLPLIRLRLAEHGRLLFETLWRRIQNPPGVVQRSVVLGLVERLAAGPVQMATLSREERAPLNWLINQAMVTCCGLPNDRGLGYELFSPLFAEFLSERLTLQRAAQAESGAGVAGGAATGSGSAPAEAPAEPGDEPDPAFAGRLTRTEVALLAYFRRHARQLVTPEQLLRDVWRRPDATPRRVQEAIRRLRAELEAADPPVGVIENDRGRGYRFVPA